MEFTLSAGGTHEFKLSYDEESQIPNKLGDGNFGIVFEGIDDAGPIAVKFIYLRQATDQTGSIGDADYKLTRIKDELQVTSRILEILNVKARNSEVARDLLNSFSQHLVLPKSFCMDLTKNDVFDGGANEKESFGTAKAELMRRDIHLSKYAYTMEKFDCTLKDLVEGAYQTDSSSYRRLEESPMLERERSSLFVLQGVARGLKVLHLSGLRHQDIKPANIYYKKDDTDVDFRLGDLGFLRPQSPVQAGSGMVPSHALAIGTKHYRSIEQIDFSDTSEVAVELSEDKQIATIISRDPKFLRTNIGAGDLVFFPKSNAQRLFVIQTIKRDEKNNTTTITVPVPKESSADEEEAGLGVIFDDQNTQVSFVKNPTAKTDLFGLGGILFDVISAGDSPERLYDLLRKFDTAGSSIADQIISYYSIWQADQYVDPAVSAIFQRVKGASKESVTEATLTFLLRCCMSEPQDSFYNEFGFANKKGEETAWDKILEEITRLIDHLQANTHSRIKVNCLTGGIKTSESTPNVPRLLMNYLPLLTNPSPDGPNSKGSSGSIDTRVIDHTERCLRGLTLIDRVSKRMCFLSKRLISSTAEDGFISFSPEHLNFDKDFFSLDHNEVFGALSQRDYYRKLINLDTTLCSLSPYQDRFLPVWWRDRSRRIEIVEKTENGSKSSLKLRYTDFLPVWTGLEKGDYVVVLGAGSANSLLTVEEVRSSIEIVFKEYVEDPDEVEKGRFGARSKGYVIKRLDPVDYLAGMHAVYIFHALVLGSGPDDVLDPGAGIGARIANGWDERHKRPSEDFSGKSKLLSIVSKKADIAAYTHRLYFWLTSRGYCKLKLDNSQSISLIQEEVGSWLRYCSELLGSDSILSDVPLDLGEAMPEKVNSLNLSSLVSLQMKQDAWDDFASE